MLYFSSVIQSGADHSRNRCSLLARNNVPDFFGHPCEPCSAAGFQRFAIGLATVPEDKAEPGHCEMFRQLDVSNTAKGIDQTMSHSGLLPI